jgi:EpsI family protein
MVLRWKSLFVALLMVAAGAMAHIARPTIKIADSGPKVDLEALFPRTFGDWRVDDRMPVILPSPDLQAKLDAIYNQVLSRTYVNGRGERVMLSVAYGGDQSDGTSAHRPEVCYPAQGFQVVANQSGRIDLDGHRIPVRRLVTRLGARVEPLTYWIVVGDEVVTSGTQQKLAQLRYGMRGLIPDGMLVRISSIGGDEGQAYALQSKFLNDMVRAIEPEQRGRVVGS